MKRCILTLLFLLISTGMMWAQTLTPKVSPTSGGYSTGTGISLSWTMGQTYNTTLQQGTTILTQGEQQPEIDILTGSITGSPFCAGSVVSVPFIALGYYGGANVFTAQLSNGSGSFTSPVNIGTLTSTGSGTVSATIPSNTVSGTGYRIRVVANLPTYSGKNNGVNITINAIPVPVITETDNSGNTANDAIICNGGTANLSVAGGTTYAWSNSSTASSFAVTPTSNTTYTVTATTSGCSATASKIITVKANPIAASTAGTIACNGGMTTITVTATGGTPSYTGTGTFSGITANASPYSYTVSDANGCTSTTAQTITQPATLIFTTVVTNVTTCGTASSGSIAITATGGMGTKTYSDNNGSTYSGVSLFSSLTVGTYTVKVKDGNSCLSAASNLVVANDGPVITNTPVVVNATTCSAANGKISIMPTGGDNFYNYSLNCGSTWQSSNMFTGLIHGTYSMEAKDAAGCTSSCTVAVVASATGLCRGARMLFTYEKSDFGSFNVYPNPASDQVTLSFSSDKEDVYNIRLLDIAGRVVINETQTSLIGDNQYQMNLYDIAEGVYMVVIHYSNGTMQKKLVIQR